MLSLEEGTLAVGLARRALAEALLPAGSEGRPRELPHELPTVFAEPRGVFVTLKRYPDDSLRGCIGYPLPVLPLGTAVARAAVSAAVDDYRFRPVRAVDLPRITVEVSVLTVPVPVRFSSPEEAIRSVVVGRDGLIVEGLGTSGLLLPQVAPEQGWTSQELLDGTCEKAGLPFGAWRDPRVKVSRFEAQVFRELSPGGEVVPEETATPTAAGRPAPRK